MSLTKTGQVCMLLVVAVTRRRCSLPMVPRQTIHAA